MDGAAMKNKKKASWIVILALSIAILSVGSFFLIQYFQQKDVSQNDFTPTGATMDYATKEPTEAPDPNAPTQRPTLPKSTSPWVDKVAQYSGFNVDFNELNKINTDVYAWIYIPNTNVDYPVAQSIADHDDSFYLSHNIYRQYQFSGTIYSEVKNHIDFHDRVTVLYGHNMLNGSMFASLHNFEDQSFFDANNTIFILTKDKVYTYLVYSVYTYDDRHILNSFHFEDDKVFRSYLDDTLDPHTYSGIVRKGVKLDLNSKILTLSTCTNGAANTRLLVQGVLVNEQYR